MSEVNPRLLTVRQVAERLQLTAQTVRNYCEEREIVASKLRGGAWRISEADLDEYIARQSNSHQPEAVTR